MTFNDLYVGKCSIVRLTLVKVLLLTYFFAPGSAATLEQPVTVIYAGEALLGDDLEPARGISIVVTGSVITRIDQGFSAIRGANTIDLSDRHVLPGMIDAHVHLQHGGSGPNLWRDLALLEDGIVLLRAYSEAQKSLNAGFTTVRDLAGDPDVVFDLRDAIDSGIVNGPRIIAAGPALMPTGGGIVRGLRRDWMERLASSNLEYPCDGMDECRKAVRALAKAGADVIKVVVTASISAPNEGGSAYQMTVAELMTVVETAHLLDLKVAAHAHGLEGINMAIEAGVDSVEHGTFADESSMELFRETGSFLVPTPLDTTVRRVLSDPRASEAQKQKIVNANEHWGKMLELAVEKKVNVVFGTDTKVGAHGRSAEKFKMYRVAGMDAHSIVASATINAAKLLGIDADTGSITVGKEADLIAVSASPLLDIEELTRVEFVMRAGKTVKLGEKTNF